MTQWDAPKGLWTGHQPATSVESMDLLLTTATLTLRSVRCSPLKAKELTTGIALTTPAARTVSSVTPGNFNQIMKMIIGYNAPVALVMHEGEKYIIRS